MRKIAKQRAWMTTAETAFILGLEERKDESVIASLGFSSSDMSPHGWTEVGEALIDVELYPRDKLVAGQIESLRKKQAAAVALATEIEGSIQKLLAIGYCQEGG